MPGIGYNDASRKQLVKCSVQEGNNLKLFRCLWEFLNCESMLWICAVCAI